MYICICKGITDKQLEEAQRTSSSFQEVCKKLGLGSECGTCITEASMFAHSNKELKNQTKVSKTKSVQK